MPRPHLWLSNIMDDHFNTSMKQNKSGDLTYLWWFYKWSPVARYIATSATRHQLLWWWHRCLQIPVWGPGICWASYCSPQVSHPPTPMNYLKGKASNDWKLIERRGEQWSWLLLSWLKFIPSHTVWWRSPRVHSCSRTKRFSLSLIMVRTSELLAGM